VLCFGAIIEADAGLNVVRVTRAVVLYSALTGLAASGLASCAVEEVFRLPPQASAVLPAPPPPAEAPLPAPVPRPTHKPSPPPVEEAEPATADEALAMTTPGPPGGLPGQEAALPPSGPGAPSPSPPSAGPVLPQTSELIGLDQPGATRLFGPATERSEAPPATVWRYKSPSCELDLFFYLDLRSGRMRTLHYKFKGDGADTARRRDCLQSLLVARSD
jgi:hypothetical protein